MIKKVIIKLKLKWSYQLHFTLNFRLAPEVLGLKFACHFLSQSDTKAQPISHAWPCDWLMELLASYVIGYTFCFFGFGFTALIIQVLIDVTGLILSH